MPVNARVMSKFNYGSLVWLSSRKNYIEAKHNIIARCAARLLFNKSKFDLITSDVY